MPSYRLTVPDELDAEIRSLAFLQGTNYDRVVAKAIAYYSAISKEVARDPEHLKVAITRDGKIERTVEWK